MPLAKVVAFVAATALAASPASPASAAPSASDAGRLPEGRAARNRSSEGESNWATRIREELQRGSKPYLDQLPPAMRQPTLECAAEKFLAQVPDREVAQQLGNTRLKMIAKKVGFDCGRAEGRRLLSGKSWTPEAITFLEWNCRGNNDEALQPYCGCVASQAPKHFTSPAAYLRMTDAQEANTATARERKSFEAMWRACMG